MDNIIFSTFNDNYLYSGYSAILTGGQDTENTFSNNSIYKYIVIIAIVSLIIIVMYYYSNKKEIFGTNPSNISSDNNGNMIVVKPLMTEISPIEQSQHIEHKYTQQPPQPPQQPPPQQPPPSQPQQPPLQQPPQPPQPLQPQQQQLAQSSRIIDNNLEKEIREIKNNISQLKNNTYSLMSGRQFDPISVYDYRKMYDPFVDPRGRTSADEIPTLDVALQFNIPTQGFPDKYHRIGLLIETGEPVRRKRDLKTRNGSSLSINSGSSTNTNSDSSTNTNSGSSTNKHSTYSINSINSSTIGDINSDNKILELIGKKMAHNWYRYFTSISIGNKVIKINVHNRNRKELYDDDRVYIPELSKWYRVKIDIMDMIDYSPYLY
jgi:hypothetical protein